MANALTVLGCAQAAYCFLVAGNVVEHAVTVDDWSGDFIPFERLFLRPEYEFRSWWLLQPREDNPRGLESFACAAC